MNFKINATYNLAQDILVRQFHFNEFALFSFVPETEERKFFFQFSFFKVWALRAAFDRDDIWQHWWKLYVLPQLLVTQNDVCEFCSRSVELCNEKTFVLYKRSCAYNSFNYSICLGIGKYKI